MKGMMSRLFGVLDITIESIKQWLRSGRLAKILENQIADVKNIKRDYESRLAKLDVIYTTVRSFNGESGDKIFWPWARSVLLSEEYRYLIFIMRENVIRELTQTSDIIRIHELNGQLKMLQIMDTFLTRGLAQYDAEQKNKV
jgi:hypothetical protein